MKKENLVLITNEKEMKYNTNYLCDKIDIKSSRQVWEEQKEVMEGLVKKRFARGDLDFHDEIDHLLDEIEEEQKGMISNTDGPNKDDTIH